MMIIVRPKWYHHLHMLGVKTLLDSSVRQYQLCINRRSWKLFHKGDLNEYIERIYIVSVIYKISGVQFDKKMFSCTEKKVLLIISMEINLSLKTYWIHKYANNAKIVFLYNLIKLRAHLANHKISLINFSEKKDFRSEF